MTRVAKSSSSKGSSPVANKLPVFNVATEAGTLALLRALHRSGVKQKDKNELRDQLFEYVQQPGKGQKALVTAFKEVGFDIVEEAGVDEQVSESDTMPQPAAHSGLGQSRAVPSFTPASVRGVAAASTKPEPESTSETQAAQETSAPGPSEPEVKEEETPPESAAKGQTGDVVAEITEPEPAPEPAPKLTPDPIPEAPVEPTPEPEPVQKPVAKPEPEPTPTSTAAAGVSGDPMTRIKEIKHVINVKVGNPITLIDTDNQVGREYMNALLAAMKAANGGTPAEVETAMARLEKAYEEALRVIATVSRPETVTDQFVKSTENDSANSVAHGYEEVESSVPVESVTTPVEPAPAPVSEPDPAPTPEPAPAPISTPAPAPAPTPEPALTAAEPVVVQQFSPASVKLPVASVETASAPEPMQTSAPTPIPAPTPEPAPVSQSVAVQADATTETPQVAPVTKPSVDPGTPAYISPGMPTPPPLPDDAEQASPLSVTVPISPTPQPAVPGVPTIPATPPKTPVTPVATVDEKKPLMSVAKEEQLQKLMQQNQLQEAEKRQQQDESMRSSTDPLMLPEVTAGLQQLLSEWSLFKSSGFFGTGPGGVDHPLYKKIAPLTLSAVIAGRFEGATPQVKQSITEYMNGWRYEEGIVHEHSETFEHYLRRVINHILTKKNQT